MLPRRNLARAWAKPRPNEIIRFIFGGQNNRAALVFKNRCDVKMTPLNASLFHEICYSQPMSEVIFQVIEDEADGGFIARALGHSIVTEADTWDELRANVPRSGALSL